jgi:hypothetical protein
MTEYEMAMALGISSDPDQNRLDLNKREVVEDVRRIMRIFNMVNDQKGKIGNLMVERWADLIPCYSFN